MGDEEDINHLKRRLQRRDKRITKLSEELKERNREVGEQKGELANLKSTVDEQSDNIVSLNKELDAHKAKIEDLTIKFSSQKLPLGSRETGWAKPHQNHQGKRIPSDDAEEMAQRINGIEDKVEIQKGEFARFLEGARCYGFHQEAGTNIELPQNTQVPECAGKAAIQYAKEVLVMHERKYGPLRSSGRKSKLFHEIATSIYYSFVGDHQAPVYVNGYTSVHKPTWKKDDSIKVDDILGAQPTFLQKCLHFAVEHSRIDVLTDEVQKEQILKTVKNIKQNHQKACFTTFGADKGRASGKLKIPPEMDPGKQIIELNNLLPKCPPLADGRPLEGRLCGNPKEKKKRPRSKKSKALVSSTGGSSTESPQKVAKLGFQKTQKKVQNKRKRLADNENGDGEQEQNGAAENAGEEAQTVGSSSTNEVINEPPLKKKKKLKDNSLDKALIKVLINKRTKAAAPTVTTTNKDAMATNGDVVVTGGDANAANEDAVAIEGGGASPVAGGSANSLKEVEAAKDGRLAVPKSKEDKRRLREAILASFAK